MSDRNLNPQEISAHPNCPRHVAVIMDGNGRWARKKGLPRIAGHKEGINSVREIVEICGEIGIKYLTLYTFSEENWKRPETEVSFLMTLLMETLRKEIRDLHRNNVKVRLIGDIDRLPEKAREGMLEGVEITKDNAGLNLVLALSYSSRREILRMVQKAVAEAVAGRLTAEMVDKDFINANLYTAGIPDPDLLVRTSGEQRISNFLLWQIAYSELYITPVLWPDFRKNEMISALTDYLGRERRFGKV